MRNKEVVEQGAYSRGALRSMAQVMSTHRVSLFEGLRRGNDGLVGRALVDVLVAGSVRSGEPPWKSEPTKEAKPFGSAAEGVVPGMSSSDAFGIVLRLRDRVELRCSIAGGRILVRSIALDVTI